MSPTLSFLFHLLLLLLFLLDVEAGTFNGFMIRDLVYGGGEFFNAEASRWGPVGAGNLITCGDRFMGGGGVLAIGGQYQEKQYTGLPAHNVIHFHMKFTIVGGWGYGHGIKVYFDTLWFAWVGYVEHPNFFVVGLCSGTQGVNDIMMWGFAAPHSGPTLTLRFEMLGGSGATFGVREIKLQFHTTTPAPTSVLAQWSSAHLKARNHPLLVGSHCSHNQYWDGANCMGCHSECGTCFGGTEFDCYTCSSTFTGTACVQCHPSCENCRGPNDDQCLSCSWGYSLIGTSCIVCGPPLIQVNANNLAYCYNPCSVNQWTYSDGKCFDDCDSRITSQSVYVYGKFCLSQCPSGTPINYDSTCRTTPCDFPMDLLDYGSYQICEYVCPPWQTKFAPTNQCINIADCVPPYKSGTHPDGFLFCEAACSNSPPDYTYWNGTCDSSCPDRMEKTTVNGFPICNPPLCGVVNCTRCASNGVEEILCKEYYNCEVSLGRFCLPYYDYGLETMIIKQITNGHFIQVQVIPSKNGLSPGENDVLTMTVDGLTVGTDYSFETTKVSLGLFQIKFLVLQELQELSLTARFIYSPNDLGLQGTLQLPRVVFLNEGIKAAAENSKGSSQLLFLLFAVSLVGMILGGGFSAIWAALPESQYAYYIIFLNVDYIKQTHLYLQSMSNYEVMLNTDEADEETFLDPAFKKSLPNKLYAMEYLPDFINNADQVFIQLLIVVVGLVVSSLALKYFRFPRQFFWLQKLLDVALRMLKWNGLIRLGLTYTLPLSLAAFVQIYSATFGGQIRLGSMIGAVLTLFFLAWGLLTMFKLIKNTPKSRLGRALYTKSYGTLWEDLDLNNTFSRYYYWLVALRGVVLAYVCVFCDMSPYIQLFSIVIYQALIVGLFLQKQIHKLRSVFSESGLNRVTFIEELLMLVMKIFILVFQFMRSSATDTTLVILGWMIVFSSASIQIIQVGFSIYQQISNRKKIYKLIKSSFGFFKKEQKVKIRRTRKFNNIAFNISKIVD